MSDPVDQIVWRPANTLRANHWNPNRMHKQESRLLALSIVQTGWIQPVLVNRNMLIIDGFHRWRLAQDEPALLDRYAGSLPTATLDVADDEAMAITVRINRAKGAHVAVEMHRLVLALLTDHGWTRARVAEQIGATTKEVDVLAQEGVFAARRIAEHVYSPAWYPVEAASMEAANPNGVPERAR
jgi:ParB-like chromosome segregation protein Spo0J